MGLANTNAILAIQNTIIKLLSSKDHAFHAIRRGFIIQRTSIITKTDNQLHKYNIIAESLQLLQLYAPTFLLLKMNEVIFRFNQLPTQFISVDEQTLESN